MRSIIHGTCACALWASSVLAGSNAGGTLVVQATDFVYTSDGTYCGQPIPRDCESINTKSSGAPIQVYTVLALFTDFNEPRLRGVEFGISYSAVEIDDWGSCGDFDYPQSGWPHSGRGTVVTWSSAQTGRITPVYWFAGYLASLADRPTFELTAHPANGGHFGDDHVPTHLDGIAAYGSLGFGAAGAAPCPVARTFVIRPDGSGDLPTIQDAIYLAAPKSIIELENGVYRGAGNRDIKLNDTYLTIRSRSGKPDSCVIDCEGSASESHRAFLLGSSEDAGPVIEGIKVIGGYTGQDLEFDASGGAITAQGESAFVLRNCVFEGCSAEWSAGAVGAGGTLLAEDCVFRNNHTRTYAGGAIHTNGSKITLRRCRFEGNHAATGGGAIQFNDTVIELEDCVFTDNSSARGGALCVEFAELGAKRCTFAGNQSPKGGAFYIDGGTAVIEESTISDNSSQSGSALYCEAVAGTLTLRKSILSYGTAGGAIRCGAITATAEACDIFGNQGGDWPSCLAGQSQINANFSADPLFCNRATRDYHLDSSSPCGEGADPERGRVGAWAVGCGETSAIDPSGEAELVLSASTTVRPNPSRGATKIGFVVPGRQPRAVSLDVFDASGRLVRRLIHDDQTPGAHELSWDGSDNSGVTSPGGMYFVRLVAGSERVSSRLLLLR